MTATVFGVGQAGNKAAIRLMELGIVDKSHVKLLNTTSKDIPDTYLAESGLYIPFSDAQLGCGKESSKGRAYMIQAISEKKLDFSKLINEDSNEVILVSSLEGGSSGGSPIVAQYLDAMNIPVHVFGFVGFQDEARGINNTLKFFKELPENAIIHTILNSHFLDYTKNYSKAELAANDEFAMEVQILLGMKLVPSSHNIDDQDIYKINTQSGYMTINHIVLDNIKNVEAFNKLISAAYEDACYMDTDPSAKRIAVMINATKRTQEMIDNSFEVLKRYTGTPIELFQHIQPDNDDDLVGDEYIDIIACGMNFPEKPIKDLSTKYGRLKEKLTTGRKSMQDIFGNIDVQDELDEFNMDVKKKLETSKADALFSQRMGMYPIKIGGSAQAVKVPTVKAPTATQGKSQSVDLDEIPVASKDNPLENTPVEQMDYQLREIDDDDEYYDPNEDINQSLNAAAIRNPLKRTY